MIEHGGAEARATHRWPARDEDDERVRVKPAGDKDDACALAARTSEG